MQFTRIKLENWMNFKSVDVPLRQRVFLVGPNASGKSNFLAAFRFLQDCADPTGEKFQGVVDSWGGISQIRSLYASKNAPVAIEVEAVVNGRDVWNYRLELYEDGRKQTRIRKEVVRHGSVTLVERPGPEDKKNPRGLSEPYLGSSPNNAAFQPLAQGLAGIRYHHIIPLLVREDEYPAADPWGGGLLKRVAQTPPKVRDQRIAKIIPALRVAIPQFKSLAFKADKDGAPHLRAFFEHRRSGSEWQTEEQLSDGTLRLFGLLWAMLDGDGPLLLEEPEISLHPALLAYLPGIMASIGYKHGRQIFVSTHSPEMLMDEGLAMQEVLLLTPTKHGTDLRPASGYDQIRTLLGGGTLRMADAVFPETAPRETSRFALFGA
jgi:predicted ATPase